MIRINLLPHREQARKERRQQFYTLVVLVLLLAGVISFVGYTLIQQKINAQQSTNDYIKSKIADLDKEIAEIKRLKEQTQSLLARKQVIENLQSNRAETVHLFNELVRQVPDGIYLKSIKQSGVKVSLTGYAQSNARVSQLMRNLDASPVLEKPALLEIKSAEVNKQRISEFSLNIDIERAPIEQEGSAPAGVSVKTEKKS